MQQVMQILEAPLSVDDYLDTVVDVWTRGIVLDSKRAERKKAGSRRDKPKRQSTASKGKR
jgi:tetrahydromethanopterin S-methyltransferase subunit H